jgi:hypothetical protein
METLLVRTTTSPQHFHFSLHFTGCCCCCCCCCCCYGCAWNKCPLGLALVLGRSFHSLHVLLLQEEVYVS